MIISMLYCLSLARELLESEKLQDKVRIVRVITIHMALRLDRIKWQRDRKKKNEESMS